MNRRTMLAPATFTVAAIILTVLWVAGCATGTGSGGDAFEPITLHVQNTTSKASSP